MKFYFLSDLHLQSDGDGNALRLIKFLQTEPQSGDVLVIGGDLFDLFVGNKKVFRKKFQEAVSAINRCSQRGVNVFYAEGNHDFYLESVFANNVKIYPEAFLLNLQKKIWIAHGDRIDPKDTGYHFLRFVLRSLPIKILVKIIPNYFLEWIGTWSSRQSRKYNNAEKISPEKVEYTKSVFSSYARSKFRESFDWVFLGHSHLKDHLEDGERVYINLGFSSEELLYVVADLKSGKPEIKSIKS